MYRITGGRVASTRTERSVRLELDAGPIRSDDYTGERFTPRRAVVRIVGPTGKSLYHAIYVVYESTSSADLDSLTSRVNHTEFTDADRAVADHAVKIIDQEGHR